MTTQLQQQSTMSTSWCPQYKLGHQDSGGRPWLATLHAYGHTLMLSLTPQGEGDGSSAFGIFLDSAHEPLPLADFNLHPFLVINHNHKCKFSGSPVSHSSELSDLQVVWGAPSTKLEVGVRSEGRRCALRFCSWLIFSGVVKIFSG